MKKMILMPVLGIVATTMSAFSPYENVGNNSAVIRVGLLACIRENAKETTVKLLSDILSGNRLHAKNIHSPAAYTFTYNGETRIMVCFDYTGPEYVHAVADFEAATGGFPELNRLLQPTPRNDGRWVQMEWICYIRAARNEGSAVDRFAMVTRIKPEKEAEYRMLHQTVWPGVIGQMTRSSYRNFSIFLTEIDGEVFVFFDTEYIGSDLTADNAKMAADPCTQRWWKLTDACQNPLPGATGPWLMMEKPVENGGCP